MTSRRLLAKIPALACAALAAISLAAVASAAPASSAAGNGPGETVRSYLFAIDKADGQAACSLLSQQLLDSVQETFSQCVSYISHSTRGLISKDLIDQGYLAQASAAKQYLVIAYKAAKADSVERNGYYATGQALVRAIKSSEPELTVRLGTLKQARLSRSSAMVYVSPASSRAKLVLYGRSRSGQIFRLTAGTASSLIITSLYPGHKPVRHPVSIASLVFAVSAQGTDYVVGFTLPGHKPSRVIVHSESGGYKIVHIELN